MLKVLTGLAALGMLIAVSATTPADAAPVSVPGAKAQGPITDFSSQYYRRRGYYRGYGYPYGYYRRPYYGYGYPYYRRYYRPAPFPFFPFAPYYW
jgi:hypothetical protein